MIRLKKGFVLFVIAALACFAGTAQATNPLFGTSRHVPPYPTPVGIVPTVRAVRVAYRTPLVKQHVLVRRSGSPPQHVIRYRPSTTRTAVRPVVVPEVVPMRPYVIPPPSDSRFGHPAFPHYGSTLRPGPYGVPVYWSF